MDDKRLAKQSFSDNINQENNIRYKAGENRYHLLDIYRHKDCENKKMPVIIDIHGGGWYYGDKELNKNYCSRLATSGDFAVVNISYRLVPEVDFFDQLADVFDAIQFVVENADKFNLDRDNVFLTGDSAGGHITSLVPGILGNKVWRSKFGIDTDVSIKAVCLTCPVVKASDMAKHRFASSYFNPIFGKKYRKSVLYQLADFENVFSQPYPPTFVISAHKDFCRGQARYAVDFLDKNGVDTEFAYLDNSMVKGHKLTHVFNISQPDWEESKTVNGQMLEFFKNYKV